MTWLKINTVQITEEKLGENLLKLDVEDEFFEDKYEDIQAQINKLYADMKEVEIQIYDFEAKIERTEYMQMSLENAEEYIRRFIEDYDNCSDAFKKDFMKGMIERVEIFPERLEDSRQVKMVRFMYPLIYKGVEGQEVWWDKEKHVETAALLSKLSEAKHHIEVKVDMDELDLTSAEAKATYKEIQDWVQEMYGFHVTNLNIAQVKQKHGIIERENYNKPKSSDSKQPGCPEEKMKAIEDALRHFQMI